MDTYFYTRIAMGGWAYLGTIIISRCAAHGIDWELISQASQSGLAAVAAALLGAIAGIGAPPIIGFVLQRCVSALLMPFGQSQWLYRSVEDYGQDAKIKLGLHEGIDASATFHVIFYATASPELTAWARRRRAQGYASLTTALGIAAGLFTSVLVFHDFVIWMAAAATVLMLILSLHGLREFSYHERFIEAWASTEGLRVLHDGFATKSGEIRTATSYIHHTVIPWS